jgi:hypothetical protein
MTVISKPLIGAKYAANTDNTEYTATGVRTIIDKFTAYNSDVSAAITVTVNLVASAGSAAATNVIVSKSVAAGVTETFPEVVGHVLEPGGLISVKAGTASKVVIRSSGREVS